MSKNFIVESINKFKKIKILKIFIVLILKLTLILLSCYTMAFEHVDFLTAIRAQISSDPETVIEKIEKKLLNKELNHQQKLELQIELARALNKIGSTEKSSVIAKTIITNAEKFNFLPLSAEGKYQLAISYYLQGDCTKAIKGFNEAKIEFEQVGNIERVADTLNNTASCLNQNEEALALLLQALTLAQQLDNKDVMANVLNSIGAIYFDLKKYDKSVNYTQKAIDTINSEKEPALLSTYFANLSGSHVKNKNFTLALNALNSSLIYAKKSKSKIQMSKVNLSFGELYFMQTFYKEAIVFYKKALVLSKESKAKDLQADSLLGMGNALRHTNLIEAINIGKEALAIANSLEIHVLTKGIHSLLAKCYTQNKDYFNALNHTNLYNKLNENLILESVNNEVLQLSNTIELKQQSHEIELLKKDKAIQEALKLKERTNLYSLFSAVLIFILLFLLLYRRHNNKKQSKYLNSQIALKTQHILTLGEIGRDITTDLNADDIIQKVHKHLKNLFNEKSFSIGILNETLNKIDFTSITDASISEKETCFSYEVSMSDTDDPVVNSVKNCEEVISNKFSSSLQSNNQAKKPTTELSTAIIPLKMGDSAKGCIIIKKQGKNSFTSDQLNILRTIASYTAIAVDNAHAHGALRLISQTDYLTKSPNRRAFIEKAQYQLKVNHRSNMPISFGIADIDNFKLFNDSYGHECGDFILKEIAIFFKNQLREQDLVARWGGEEFVFMLPNTVLNEAKKVLEKLRLKLEEKKYTHNNHAISVTATFGVTQASVNLNLDQIIASADSALYEGKKAGKNKVVATQAKANK